MSTSCQLIPAADWFLTQGVGITGLLRWLPLLLDVFLALCAEL